jgi:hypothetical protein
MDRRCRLRRGFPRMLRASIRPLAFAAMNDAGAAAFGAGPHVKFVSDVAATAIVTDHAWPQNLDSVEACEPITLESTSPQRTLRSAPPEKRRGASDGTVTTLRPPLGDALTNAELTSAFGGKADIERTLKSGAVLPATAAAVGMRVQARQRRPRHSRHSSLSRPPIDHVYGALHGLDAEPVQELLEGLTFQASRIKRQLNPTSEFPCAVELVSEWLPI